MTAPPPATGRTPHRTRPSRRKSPGTPARSRRLPRRSPPRCRPGTSRAALAGIEEACEQASQARRTLKAVTGGRKAPAVKPGALRELVAAHLRDHPAGNFTPHQIGKKLARSSGAVANALDTLVKPR